MAMRVNTQRLAPGERIAVAISGGADSTALLLWMAEAAQENGWTVLAAHFNHQLRGAESGADQAFIADLAARLQVNLLCESADTAALARGRSVEETARELRYSFFRRLLCEQGCSAVVTAHTRNDQAETVLMKIMRGAWTEGIAAISPEVRWTEVPGHIVRPLLEVSRAEVLAYLHQHGQQWREDASNLDPRFRRNDIRHLVMPMLRQRNPAIESTLAQMAEIARDEEEYWRVETARVLTSVTLPGRAVRGGGRAVSTTAANEAIALDAARLQTFPTAVLRRILRAAAGKLGHAPSFEETSRLEDLLLGKPGRKAQLPNGLRAERTPRELHLEKGAAVVTEKPAEVICSPGVTDVHQHGIRVTLTGEGEATLRVWRAGDRIRLRHTLSEQKVKEVLQRLKTTPQERASWPVLERSRRIVWMRGVETADAGGASVEPLRE